MRAGKLENMRQSFPELPHWRFTVSEDDRCRYRVTATRDDGITAESMTVDPDQALKELRSWAAKTDATMATREFRAIVWIGDEAGKRVTVRAGNSTEAIARLRTEYGDDATISAWNQEDSARPR